MNYYFVEKDEIRIIDAAMAEGITNNAGGGWTLREVSYYDTFVVVYLNQDEPDEKFVYDFWLDRIIITDHDIITDGMTQDEARKRLSAFVITYSDLLPLYVFDRKAE